MRDAARCALLFYGFRFLFSRKLRNSKNTPEATWQYIKPILLAYGIWMLLWLPFIVVDYRRMYPGVGIKLLAILVRRILLAGTAPYWYLLVLAESAVFLALVAKRPRLGWILCAGGILLSGIYHFEAAGYTRGIVYRIFYTVFSWNNNVIMSGFPLMFLGFAAQRQEDRLRKLSFWALLALYLLSICRVLPFRICICLPVWHPSGSPALSPVPFSRAVSAFAFRAAVPGRQEFQFCPIPVSHGIPANRGTGIRPLGAKASLPYCSCGGVSSFYPCG